MNTYLDQRSQDIITRLKQIDNERASLLRELATLRQTAKMTCSESPIPVISATSIKSSEQRLALFQKLFCCRTDVFPKLWKNSKTGAIGYSPVCKNEWVKEICFKPKVKCADCPNRSFVQLDESIVRKHLEGNITIGTYAIRPDDTCIFLAADFDEEHWMDDILSFKKAAKELGVEIYIERSRSGNGGHAWLFFSEPVSARDARLLGTYTLSKAISNRSTMSFKSYDRLFPSQDTIPDRGFGNLISLPLQRVPRKIGNSVFVNDSFEPFSDQWEFLSNVKRLSLLDIQNLLNPLLSA